MRAGKPVEVAIVGGGCAAITAAFELTRPEHQGRYHVTIYQQGWRLGGKGASGRGPADRIEEHGFHVWMGFYENAFRLMRECYEELNRDRNACPIAHWRDAFRESPLIGVTERKPNGTWLEWMAHFPPGDGLPGDPFPKDNPFTIAGYVVRAVQLVRTLLLSCQRAGGAEAAAAEPSWFALGNPEQVLESVSRLLKYGVVATTAGLVEAARALEMALRAVPAFSETLALELLDAIGSNVRRQLEILTQGDDESRRLWEIIDLTLAGVRGILRHGLLTDPRGFDAIDDYDCREWLAMNGASPIALESAYLRGLYDLGFAYEGGDRSRPRAAAGMSLRGAVRMFFTYRGSVFWKMNAGMGDIVFAPFYEVLKRRGASFRFFHRLENVKLAAEESLAPGERPYVEALEFDVQAEIEGAGEYQPLVDVRGLPCWPSAPDWAQLVGGERLQREGWEFESFWDQRRARRTTLRVVDDFDFVVLGVGIGAVPHVCAEIVARDPRWRLMTEKVATVPTQAFQIWMRESLQQLGWPYDLASVSAFAPPFDTCADMQHLVSAESWPDAPRALAYFCSALADSSAPPDRADAGYPARRRDEVQRAAIEFLEREIGHLFPQATRRPSGFRWDLLATPADGAADGDAARFASQFWTANVNPTDRYTLCPPGSSRHRISPLDNTYDNLTIAGDWTSCGHNFGCVEAAVMSGRLAAHALSGLPHLEEIVGYDHP